MGQEIFNEIFSGNVTLATWNVKGEKKVGEISLKRYANPIAFTVVDETGVNTYNPKTIEAIGNGSVEVDGVLYSKVVPDRGSSISDQVEYVQIGDQKFENSVMVTTFRQHRIDDIPIVEVFYGSSPVMVCYVGEKLVDAGTQTRSVKSLTNNVVINVGKTTAKSGGGCGCGK